jgi:hypothetical protein
VFPTLNVGSSTEEFRVRKQPWIDEHVFGPLRARGGRVIHVDLKQAPGVDVAGDLSDTGVRRTIAALGVRSVFCSNLLEHVPDRVSVCDSLLELIPPDGLLFVSCPQRYPRHDDPFDNGFRPAVGDLQALFPGTETLAAEVVIGGTYYDALGRRPLRLGKDLARACVPVYAPKRWVGTVRHLAWLNRRFSASCVCLRKR